MFKVANGFDGWRRSEGGALSSCVQSAKCAAPYAQMIQQMIFHLTFCPRSYSYSCVRVGYSAGGGVQQLRCCPEWSYFQFPGGWGCLQQQHQPPAHRCSASPPHPGLRSCRQTKQQSGNSLKNKRVLKIKRGSSLSLQLGLLYYWLEIHFWCMTTKKSLSFVAFC